MKIGCQGWNYADWATRAGGETVFYPRGTKSSEMLEIYAGAFETVEVDSTFYAIPAETAVQNWFDKTPDDFTFSLKMPQEITHTHFLGRASFGILHEFCKRVLILKTKLAAVLIQMPPQFEANPENARNLTFFLRELPPEIRFAIEFRERGWYDGETFDLLAKNRVALCLTEGTQIPRALTVHAAREKITDFAYVRFMGERDLERFDIVQRPQNMNLWRDLLIEVLANAPETYVYFSNFYEGHAPASANKLKRLFDQKIVMPDSFENQFSLF